MLSIREEVKNNLLLHVLILKYVLAYSLCRLHCTHLYANTLRIKLQIEFIFIMYLQIQKAQITQNQIQTWILRLEDDAQTEHQSSNRNKPVTKAVIRNKMLGMLVLHQLVELSRYFTNCVFEMCSCRCGADRAKVCDQ